MASDDPEFERKAADIIGLYLHPPPHAALFCVDEKSAIQALVRLDPVLPMSPGRAERHGFEYYGPSPHKRPRRWKTFSNSIRHVRLHFTATYSSWLNQVELWFARIERDVIARGIFSSVKDLARKLMRYTHRYSAAAKPFSWK